MRVTIGKKVKEERTPAANGIKQAESVKEVCETARRELLSERGAYRKVYAADNGKRIAAFYGRRIHYRTDTGEYEELHDTFTDTGSDYEIRTQDLHSKFRKNPGRGDIFEVEKDQCRAAMLSADAEKAHCTPEGCGGDICGNRRIRYAGVRSGTDFEYTVGADRIKEDIIIREKSASYEYAFELLTDNLKAEVNADGTGIDLINKGTGYVWGYIPAPFMYDARGERSDSVYYDAEFTDDGKIMLKAVADAEWINAEGRAFPVVIDPQIVVTNVRGYGYETAEYEDGAFEYNTYLKNMDSGKRELIGHKIRSEAGSEFPPYEGRYVESDIIIHKNKLDRFQCENMTKATLKLRITDSTARNVTVNSMPYSAGYGEEITVDITDKMKNADESVIVTVSQCAARGTYFGGVTVFALPVLEIEYENGRMNVTKMPDKTVYRAGDTIDTTGMTAYITYDDGTTERADENTFIQSKPLCAGRVFQG